MSMTAYVNSKSGVQIVIVNTKSVWNIKIYNTNLDGSSKSKDGQTISLI